MTELESIIQDIETTFAALTHEVPLGVVRDKLDALFGSGELNPICTHEQLRIGHAQAELIYRKADRRPGSAILYVHGGGFAVCSITSHRDLAERLALDTDAAVLLLGYRLAPEHPYPAGLEDTIGAYEWLMAQGYPATSLAIAGDSAGGNLALATLLALKQRNLPQPSCAALLSPWLDLEMKGESMKAQASRDPIVKEDMLRVWVQVYAQQRDVRDPLLSPLNGDLRELPPLHVQVGGREALLDDSLRLVTAARSAGVSVDYKFWEHQIHVFQVFGFRLADARAAIATLADFMRRHLRASPSPDRRTV